MINMKRCFSNKKTNDFIYNIAITRDISRNINDGIRSTSKTFNSFVNLDKAIEQKGRLNEVLKSLGINIKNLVSDDCPDSCFIEDTIVIRNNSICITNPGAQSRKKEIFSVSNYIKNHFNNNFKITDMNENNDNATLDGGDVLYVGNNEFYVGVNNNRTNEKGLLKLKIAFPDFKIHSIDIKPHMKNILHLKSALSIVGHNKIVLGGDTGKQIVLSNKSFSTDKFEFISIPDIEASNLIYANDAIITRSSKEYPLSIEKIKDSIGKGNVIEINMDELEKLDGALTCCSVLFNIWLLFVIT